MKDLRQHLLASSIPTLSVQLKGLSKASRTASPSSRTKIVEDIRNIAKELDRVQTRNTQENLYRAKLRQACLQEIDKITSMKVEASTHEQVTVKSYEEEQELAFQSEIFQERHREITEIEMQITSIKDLMQETSSTVYSQGAVLDRIDSYVDQTAVSTHRAVKELQQSAVLQQRASRYSCTGWLLWAAFFTGALVLIRYVIIPAWEAPVDKK